MDLYIDTAKKDRMKIALREGKVEVACFERPAERQQAELLLPLIQEILAKNNIKKSDIQRIIVEPTGESFMALRIGIATANALAFALGIPAITPKQTGKKIISEPSLVRPHYDKRPNISKEKKSL